MKGSFISVIIPAHNEEKHLSQCLTSLLSQDYPKENYEIILINNNSTDNTKKIAQSFGVKVIDQASGPVGAVRNAGARYAQGTILAFIDSDCVAPESWLTNGFTLLKEKGCAWGGGYDLRSNPFWIEKAWLLENKEAPKDLVGGCIFVMRSAFFSIGGFDEKITSGEDTKLTISLRKKGYDVFMSSKINVIHLGNPITLKHFIVRQIWHSENYLQNLSDSLKDPTFYLLITFSVSIVTIFLCAILKISSGFTASLAITLILPALLSAKRLQRSKNLIKELRNLPLIYLLDIAYMSARTIGLYKSLEKMTKKLIHL